MVTEDTDADPGTFVRTLLGVDAGAHRSRGLLAPRRVLLHAMISSAGYEGSVSPGYDWHGRRRGTAEFVLIQYTISGRGQLMYHDENYVLTPGQAMILHFPDDNRYWLAPGDSWEHAYACLHGREVLRAWRTVSDRLGPILPLTKDSVVLRTFLELVRATLDDALTNPFMASAQAYALAMALLASVPAQADAGSEHPGVQQAKAWARQHASEDIGVADLARIAGLSRFHFSRLFQRQEGRTPATWITDLRLRQATRLLRDPASTIASVAASCGYRDPAYFSRTFRRSFGVSPGEFRSSGMY